MQNEPQLVHITALQSAANLSDEKNIPAPPSTSQYFVAEAGKTTQNRGCMMMRRL